MRHVTNKIILIQKRLLIFVTLFTFLTGTATPAWAARPVTTLNKAPETLYLGIGSDKGAGGRRVEVTATRVELENAQEIQALIHEKARDEATTVIVSSDIDEVIAETAVQKDLPAKRFFLAPAGDFLKNLGINSYRSILKDKIGAVILTYTVGTDIYIWMHIASMTTLEQSMNAIYTIGLAIIFGLNKDAWANSTKPLQHSLRNFLNAHNLKPTHYKELGVRFLANLTLGSAVAMIRVPLISLSAMMATGIHLNYFTRPLLANLISTAALFMWSEHMAMIDELEHPRAKFIFRRISEVRSLILGTFATTAALMNPSVHGAAPWITLGVLGVMGSSIYFNSDRINKWIKHHPQAKLISGGMTCRQLFN